MKELRKCRHCSAFVRSNRLDIGRTRQTEPAAVLSVCPVFEASLCIIVKRRVRLETGAGPDLDIHVRAHH
jgi:hypothetical protein